MTPSSNTSYITPEGARALREELDHLWRVTRRDVTRRVAAAAALGDRSDNAEYQYGKQQLREIDRRIRYLSKRLDSLTVVDRLPRDRESVYFGAWIGLLDEDGSAAHYRIVGSDEIDLKRGWISVDSPLGSSLLGKKVGDEITVSVSESEKTYEVIDIAYESPGPSTRPC